MIDMIRSVIMVDLKPGTTDEQVTAFRGRRAGHPRPDRAVRRP
jgi:hypothetical protein